MGLELWMVGKTRETYLETGIAAYEKLIQRHVKIRTQVIPDPRNASRLPQTELRKQEAAAVLERIAPADLLILLDENGKSMDSRQFASLLEKSLVHSGRRTIFLIGGAYGFDDRLYERADQRLSLSKMTFSHQLIRLIFWEQLYRGISILKGLPYHND